MTTQKNSVILFFKVRCEQSSDILKLSESNLSLKTAIRRVLKEGKKTKNQKICRKFISDLTFPTDK